MFSSNPKSRISRRLETPVAPLRGDLDLHRGRLSSDLDQRGQGHQLSWAAAKAAGHGHFLFHLLSHLVPGFGFGMVFVFGEWVLGVWWWI